MEKATGFSKDLSGRLCDGASRNRVVMALWDISSDGFREYLAEKLGDERDWERTSEFTLGNFVYPAIECLQKGFSEEFVRTASIDTLGYAADFPGSPEDFQPFMDYYDLWESPEQFVRVQSAFSRYRDALQWFAGIPDKEKYLGCLPEWVRSFEKEVFIKRIYQAGEPAWYASGFKGITREQWQSVMENYGCKLLRLAILWIAGEDVHDKHLQMSVLKAVRWVCVWSDGIWKWTPLYKWYECGRVGSDAGTMCIRGNAVFVGACEQLPDYELPFPLDTESTDPICTFNCAMQKKYGISGGKNWILEYTAWVAVYRGFHDWMIYLLSPDLFMDVIPSVEESFVARILQWYYDSGGCISTDSQLGGGTIRISGVTKYTILAKLDGSLKNSAERGERIYASTEKNDNSWFTGFYSIYSNWLRKQKR